MPCLQDNTSSAGMQYDMMWLRDLTNVDVGGYSLFLSNTPERLNQTSLPDTDHEGVLWHYKSPELDNVVHIRMYIWHVNHANDGETPFPGAVNLGITLRNPMQEGTIQVTGGQCQVSPFGPDPLTAGICLAKATLGNTLDPFPIGNVTHGANSLVAKHRLNKDRGVGAVYDFTVGADVTPFQFELRTVASPTAANLNDLLGDPVTADLTNGGGRGYWEHNQITADVAHGQAPASPGEHWSVTRNGGPDQVFTKLSSFDPANAVTNRGNYGVLYDPITIRLTNATQPTFTVRARLAPRNTGMLSAYGGAVDRGPETLGVLALKYNPTTEMGNVVFLHDISVPMGGAAQPWPFRLMHAGAATMPVSVLLSLKPAEE